MQDITPFLYSHPNLSIAALVIIILLTIVELLRMRRNVFNITPASATQLINRQNAVIIDLRSADAFSTGHIIDSQLMASADIDPKSKKLEKFKKRPIIFVCQSGLESQKVAALMIKDGYNAFSLAGGIRSWVAAQFPLVKN